MQPKISTFSAFTCPVTFPVSKILKHLAEKGVVRGDLKFEVSLSVAEGADILGHVQKTKKDKAKRSIQIKLDI